MAIVGQNNFNNVARDAIERTVGKMREVRSGRYFEVPEFRSAKKKSEDARIKGVRKFMETQQRLASGG